MRIESSQNENKPLIERDSKSSKETELKPGDSIDNYP